MTNLSRSVALCCALLWFFAPSAAGQDYQPIIDHYSQEADVYSPIYNGKFPPQYHSRYLGTFYLDSEEFLPGTVVYNGKLYTDVELNLNAHLDELYIVIRKYHTQSVMLKDYVSEFTIGDKAFTKILFKDWPGAPREGYFQVLHNGERIKVFKWTHKSYNKANPSETQASYVFDSRFFYYVVKDGVFIPVKNKGSFLKALSSHKKEVKDYIGQHKLILKKEARDQSFAACAAYYETL